MVIASTASGTKSSHLRTTEDGDGGDDVYVNARPKPRSAEPMVRRNLSVDTSGANDHPRTYTNEYLSSFTEAVVPNLTRRLHSWTLSTPISPWRPSISQVTLSLRRHTSRGFTSSVSCGSLVACRRAPALQPVVMPNIPTIQPQRLNACLPARNSARRNGRHTAPTLPLDWPWRP